MTPIILLVVLALCALSAFLPTNVETARRMHVALVALAGIAIIFLASPFLADALLSVDSGSTLAPSLFAPSAIFALDAVGAAFLLVVAIVFTASSLIGIDGVLRAHKNGTLTLVNVRTHCGALSVLYLGVVLAVVANNLALLWCGFMIAVLALAVLVSIHNRDLARSLALFGTLALVPLLVGIAFIGAAATPHTLLLTDLLANIRAGTVDAGVLRIGFVLSFLGLASIVGFAPLHAWLLRVYDYASPAVAATLGALIAVAFVALLRLRLLVDLATGDGDWTRTIFMVFAVLSLVTAVLGVWREKKISGIIGRASLAQSGLLAFAAAAGLAGIIPLLLLAAGNALSQSALQLALHGENEDAGDTSNILRLFAVFALLAFIGAPLSMTFPAQTILFGYAIGLSPVFTLIVLLLSVLIAFALTAHLLPMLFRAHHEVMVDGAVTRRLTLVASVVGVELVCIVACGVWFLTPSAIGFVVALARLLSPSL